MPTSMKPLTYAIISGVLFGISAPIAKLLVVDLPPVALAGLLYIGAFLGLFLFTVLRKAAYPNIPVRVSPLEKRDLPWLTGAILLGGIAAPIAMMTGLTMASGSTSSLLLNLEGVATTIVAVLVFKEFAGRRLWIALILMTLASALLTWDPGQGAAGLSGPLLIILAMFLWGIDNNLTRHISNKDPVRIAQLKGLIAGTTSLGLAVMLGLQIPLDVTILYAFILGALCYGLSSMFFVKGLEGLGSSRTGALFSLGPFLGALASVLIFGEALTWGLGVATALMAFGVWMMLTERHDHEHRHEPLTHSHVLTADAHHQNITVTEGADPHEHTHDALVHSHPHWPDQHHRHKH
jgi:drug/metabolite transporter (DMT)-like permease